MSVRGATGGTCPAFKSAKHEEKQSCLNQKLNWWREAWFSLLSQNKRIAHLLLPQIFTSAESTRIDIMSAKLPPSASFAFLHSPRPTRITWAAVFLLTLQSMLNLIRGLTSECLQCDNSKLSSTVMRVCAGVAIRKGNLSVTEVTSTKALSKVSFRGAAASVDTG
jgi:hypothetical protein